VGPRTAASAEAGTGAGTEAGATRRADRFDVILIDRVGVLGDLYGAADLAFVGGGFHSAGLHSVIEPAAFGVPVLLGMGNHDARGPFRQVVLGEQAVDEQQPYYYSTEIAGVNLIMLDSQIPNAVPGRLDEAQLDWLANELTKPVRVGHLIALHHPPVSSTVALLDTMVLTNPAALAAVIAKHDNVLGILSGHIHFNHVARFQNTFSFTTPAVLYTIDPGVQKNFRALDGSGFAIGTVRNDQLFMNTVMMPGGETELVYRQL